MESLKLILDFLLKISDNIEGSILFMLWLFMCIVAFMIFILLCKVMNIITAIQEDMKHKREMKLKRNIYHRYAEIANKAKNEGNYQMAIFTMDECAEALLNPTLNKISGDDGYDSITNEFDDTGTTQESVSEQSEQSVDRLSDITEESFAKVTD